MPRAKLFATLAALPVAALAACATGTPVEYADGQCFIGGAPATLDQVETHQAALTQHILSRQPILTAIVVAAVVIAGGGYLQRILTILAARRAPAETFGERLRKRMERYRAHPVRYFCVVGSILAVLIAAGVVYVSMDADRRASERSLATLQFCHLALRSANEQHVLAEQREHLASIQSTEHDIQALVDKLPPAEQAKAREIAGQLSASLGQQRTMVAQYAARADENAKAVAEHQAQVEQGLSKLDGEVVELQNMPGTVTRLATDLHDVSTRTTGLGGQIEACNEKADALAKSVDAVTKQLEALASKPAPVCSPPAQTTALAPAPPPPSAPPSAPAAASSAGSGSGSGA